MPDTFQISRRSFIKRASLASAATGLPLWFVERDLAWAAEQVAAPSTSPNNRPGLALIGCDAAKSAVRQQLVGDAVRTSGHVVYRAVVDAAEFPRDLQWNARIVWASPNGHLMHCPLRRGEQYNVVVTFHSRKHET